MRKIRRPLELLPLPDFSPSSPPHFAMDTAKLDTPAFMELLKVLISETKHLQVRELGDTIMAQRSVVSCAALRVTE